MEASHNLYPLINEVERGQAFAASASKIICVSTIVSLALSVFGGAGLVAAHHPAWLGRWVPFFAQEEFEALSCLVTGILGAGSLMLVGRSIFQNCAESRRLLNQATDNAKMAEEELHKCEERVALEAFRFAAIAAQTESILLQASKIYQQAEDKELLEGTRKKVLHYGAAVFTNLEAYVFNPSSQQIRTFGACFQELFREQETLALLAALKPRDFTLLSVESSGTFRLTRGSIDRYMIEEGEGIPSNPHLPVLHYKGVLIEHSSRAIIDRFEGNGWGHPWVGSIFSYDHFHTNTHEAIGVVEGWCVVQLGGHKDRLIKLHAGDVLFIPAGVAHRRIEARDFVCIGSYSTDDEYDMREPARDQMKIWRERIAKVPHPQTDPVFGCHGPLREYRAE